MRWLLIDRFISIERGRTARAVRGVTRSEGALTDDFPAYPVMPPSLLLEMMAQVGGVLVGATIDFSREVVLAKISQAAFRRRVLPSALLEIGAELEDRGEEAAVTACRITENGAPVAEARIFFGLFAQLDGRRDGSVVFSRDFMESFAIREVIAAGEARP
jgi:3-hydroxyacyl-[acyl-carrier-protein] dehydratase